MVEDLLQSFERYNSPIWKVKSSIDIDILDADDLVFCYTWIILAE